MRFSYDPRYNIAYIRLQKKSEQAESIKISDQVVIDMAPDGTVYGIELLNASEQLKTGDMGKIIFINEKTGETVDLSLSIP